MSDSDDCNAWWKFKKKTAVKSKKSIILTAIVYHLSDLRSQHYDTLGRHVQKNNDNKFNINLLKFIHLKMHKQVENWLNFPLLIFL